MTDEPRIEYDADGRWHVVAGGVRFNPHALAMLAQTPVGTRIEIVAREGDTLILRNHPPEPKP